VANLSGRFAASLSYPASLSPSRTCGGFSLLSILPAYLAPPFTTSPPGRVAAWQTVSRRGHDDGRHGGGQCWRRTLPLSGGHLLNSVAVAQNILSTPNVSKLVYALAGGCAHTCLPQTGVE